MAGTAGRYKIREFDANGDPLSSGKLYTYTTGTATPLATYTDSGGGTPNANPVILDSRGEADVWLDVTLTYRFVLKTSADVTIWTVDGIRAHDTLLSGNLSASSGSSLVGFIRSETDAVARTVQAKLRAGLPISLEDFGGSAGAAAGTNDAAWTDALAALPAGGGVIQFESVGIYDFNTGFTWSNKPVILQGRGSNIQPSMGTHLRFAAGQTGINPQNGASGLGSNSGMRDLRIVGKDTALGTNDGVRIQCPRFYAQNVVSENFGRYGFSVISGAVTATNANLWLLANCFSYNNFGDGFYADGSNCIGCSVGFGSESNDGWGLYDNGLGITHIAPIIENNGTGGHRLGASSSRCRTYAAYKEEDAFPGIQIDLGSGGYHYLDYLAMADEINDNSASASNEIVSTAGNAVLHRKIAVGTSSIICQLTASGILMDLGGTFTLKNVAQDAIWEMVVNASKQLSVSSAQAKALLLGNPLQMNAARLLQAQGATVASASELTLGAAGNRFQISGITNIDKIDSTDWTGGSIVTLHFQGSLTVNHATASNAAFKGLRLAGAANFAATASDQLTLQYDSTDAVWYEVARVVI